VQEGQSAAVGAAMSVGTQIAGYRLEELVGRGGMGVVYRAHDVALERSVALKLLSPSLAEDRDFRERFLVESRLAASLEHPNVVPIHDAGEADGQLYLAMRYVEGTDLKRLLQEDGPLAPARAIAICAQVAEALDAAHARGLVHRDVKPSNVLLDEHEHAYLADFGLTRRLSEQAPGFEAGLSLGTPSYVAPEQIEGNELDGRADQYSLGCLLHECLTGEPPFPRGSEAATLFAHLEEQPSSPPGLEQVIPRALAKDPANRYESCRAFVSEARAALGLEPRRTRWPLAVAGLGAALIGAALLAFLVTRGDGTGQAMSGGKLLRIDPAKNTVAATIPVGQDPSAVSVGQSGVWVASRGDGTVSRIDPAQNRILFKASAHGKPTEIAFSGGNAIVSNGPQDANVAVIDVGTGGETDVISLAAGGGFFGSARVAAGKSGIWLAGSDRTVARLDLAAGRAVHPVFIAPPHDERANAYFSGIAVADEAVWVVGDLLDPSLWRIDAATGKIAARIRLPFAPKDVAVGAGAVWVTSQLDDTVSRINPATNRITATIPVGRGAAGVAFGAGSVWVANEVDGTVSRIDPKTLGVVGMIDVDGSPDEITADDDSVWVAAREVPDASGRNDGEIRIGVLSACEGGFGVFSDVSLAGAELPLLDRGARLVGPKPVDGVTNATVAGKEVRLFTGCGDDSAEKALSEVRRLVEQVGVDVLIGSTQIGESFAIKEYARKHPGVTFVDGTTSGQAVTLHYPAPNFFRFSTDGAQWMAGLGAYAYDNLGWRSVVTAADDDGFAYTQVAGFVAEFCALGGKVAKRIWAPLGTRDYTPYTRRVPARGVDGFLLAGYGPMTAAFVNGVPQLRGNLARKVVAGILSAGDPDQLNKRFAGVLSSLPVPAVGKPPPPEYRKWVLYIDEYGKAFPELAGFAFSVFPIFYRNSMEATLEALAAVDGDLSGDQSRFRAALAKVELDAPNGRIRLDENHQAVGPNYLNRLGVKGVVDVRTVRRIPDVEETFGGYFRRNGPMPSRTYPPCVKRRPPPWAR
jgi:YVTN family beta-propeller protein